MLAFLKWDNVGLLVLCFLAFVMGSQGGKFVDEVNSYSMNSSHVFWISPSSHCRALAVIFPSDNICLIPHTSAPLRGTAYQQADTDWWNVFFDWQEYIFLTIIWQYLLNSPHISTPLRHWIPANRYRLMKYIRWGYIFLSDIQYMQIFYQCLIS